MQVDTQNQYSTWESDARTLAVLRDIANSIDPAIQVEIDFPSKKPDKMMPILDMKMTMDNNNMVKYKFYRTPRLLDW